VGQGDIDIAAVGLLAGQNDPVLVCAAQPDAVGAINIAHKVGLEQAR
jgi:hypothetical protein